MRAAVGTTERRRLAQIAHNREHGIEPRTVTKNVSDILGRLRSAPVGVESSRSAPLSTLLEPASDDVSIEVARLEEEMLRAAGELRFEEAAALRDLMHELTRQTLDRDD